MSTPSEVTQPTPRSAGRIPATLWAAGAAFTVFAVVTALFAAEFFGQTSANPEAERVEGALGAGVVSGPPAMATGGVLGVFVTIAVLGALVMLLAGRAWARMALVGLGAFGLVVLAWGATWHVFVAAAVLLVGTVALMTPSAHRHVQGR
ncbi:hypothetical protein [Pseudonocardia sp. WMMC193]|uniref:hypothetical protein n=1 Tax=Pseudonocardia sp. WMMC193 TaxID=2911965 RepID=UPI001F28F210|nr:hypothetical protein [Pseudonocardia sp. WMMC193]MCF7550719.1 hypothetical protein [Pseudonocardia sp. WMMC193]